MLASGPARGDYAGRDRDPSECDENGHGVFPGWVLTGWTREQIQFAEVAGMCCVGCVPLMDGDCSRE